MVQLKEFEEASKFLRLNIDRISGASYYNVRTIAETLRDIDPLVSTLLYRKLIHPILEDAKSKRYTYAAKDLLMCGILNNRIDDWGNFMNHDDYSKEVTVNGTPSFSRFKDVSCLVH